MKANELMIGDWVMHYNGTPMQVTRIDYTENGGHFACGFPHCWEYNNKYEPIEMTTDILKKSGFTEVLPDAWTIEGFGVMFRMINGHLWYELTDVPVSITWVHEFQHVLKAARINEKVNI